MRKTNEAHLDYPKKQPAPSDTISRGRLLSRIEVKSSIFISTKFSERSLIAASSRLKAKQQVKRHARQMSYSIVDKSDKGLPKTVSVKESPLFVARVPVQLKAGHPTKFITRTNNLLRPKS